MPAGTLLASSARGRLEGEEEARVPTILERIERGMSEAPLAMRFRGGTAEDCLRWQAEFGRKLDELLGSYRPPREWEAVTRKVTPLGDHRRVELVLNAPDHPSLPLYLLLPGPEAATRRVPGLLALHGHGEHGHHPVAGRDDLPGVAEAIAKANYDYGRQLVRRGYAVAVPCLTPFGDRLGDPRAFRGNDPCSDTFQRLQMLGKLLIAENLRDGLWALEHLAQHEEVDGDRLGCVGLSYGGRMTMFTAAVEPRIKVAVVSGNLNVLQERLGRPHSCGAQIVPGLLNHGDVPEIASLIAPRPCLWEVGSRDSLNPPRWVDAAYAQIGLAYEALGAGENLQIDRFDGGHEWSGRRAYPLIEEVLG